MLKHCVFSVLFLKFCCRKIQFNVKDPTYQKCTNIEKWVFPSKLKQIRTFLNEKSKSLARDLATLHTANAEIDNLLHPFSCAANLKYMGVSCQLLSTAHDRLLLRAEHNAIQYNKKTLRNITSVTVMYTVHLRLSIFFLRCAFEREKIHCTTKEVNKWTWIHYDLNAEFMFLL